MSPDIDAPPDSLTSVGIGVPGGNLLARPANVLPPPILRRADKSRPAPARTFDPRLLYLLFAGLAAALLAKVAGWW